ncbi:MAG TPA: hypothetical protein DCY06_11495 [Bacteroidetes bacterium]|nr:hypothetical protein [Bacteroidota bacterium]HRF67524.1 hypothetical protein [Ignavibacteria bacterium]HRJ84659.1 hypothetical protein [Ignavibacteria bacterium]
MKKFTGKTSFYQYYKSLNRSDKKKLENEIEYILLVKLRTTCTYNRDIDITDIEKVREIRKLLDQFRCFNSDNYVIYLERFYNWLYHWNNFLINKDTFEKDTELVKQSPKEWHRLLPYYVYIAKQFSYYKTNKSIFDRKVIEHIRNIAGKKNVNYKAVELALHRFKVSEGLIPPRLRRK